ncbi:GDP-L-fucose synthase family protein [Cryptosporangium arvum]|uniref:GDP-L-fucose synthase family protein n=1 Tax=Cryptosporangium arvum TaxID=80871 RepID=UPI0004B358BC|nr:GDP-L-fucose synthase [Cryptosporangium arvum]
MFHHPVPRDARVYIAGHGGLVGSALWRYFESVGFTNLVGRRSKELDLRDRESVRAFFDEVKPEYVIDAAAKVGGIFANSTYPAEFLSDNLRIQTNLLDAASEFGVTRFLFLGSSCIYPKFAPQPIREDSLLTGPLEETNDAYAIAKISGVMQVQAIRRQYGRSFISAMPTNLYGPGDNFEIPGAHVMPMVMRRMHEARDEKSFTIYGTGTPRREFLHTDDLARACLVLLERYDDPAPINIGVGEDVTIDELVQMIADVVGYEGEFTHDTSKPDGTPRKVLDVSRIKALGWEPTVELRDGIRGVYEWFLEHQATFRR